MKVRTIWKGSLCKSSSWHDRVKDRNLRLAKAEVSRLVCPCSSELLLSLWLVAHGNWLQLGGQHFSSPSLMKKGQKHITWSDTAADAACCSAGLYIEVYHVSWIAKNSIRQGEWLHILTRRQDSWWGKSLKDKCL